MAFRSIDENDSLVIFEWEVDYEDFKEVGGYVELMAVALTGDGRQIWSDAKVVRITEFDPLSDPTSGVADVFELTGEKPSLEKPGF